jgi:uncharacterized SAM-binding protein YcdF (DUF218 family)
MAFRKTTPRSFTPRRSYPFRRLLVSILLTALLFSVGWGAWVTHQINVVAGEDQARPADAIAVFGAAEYAGHPSPVYHARLDHAIALYQRQIAPLVITLGGGSDKDSGKTEGGVGRDYLLANGVPLADIIAETHSIDTGEQVDLLAQIAEDQDLHHIVVVSDPTHLFRISVLCRRAGLDVYTSPRPPLGHIDTLDLWQRYFHEIVSYTALELGLSETWLHRWVEGKSDD